MARTVDHAAKKDSNEVNDSGQDTSFLSPRELTKSGSASSTASGGYSSSKKANRKTNEEWDQLKVKTGSLARVVDACRRTTHLTGPGQEAVWCWDFHAKTNLGECVKRAQKASPNITDMLPPSKLDREVWRQSHGMEINKAMRTKRNSIRTAIEKSAYSGDDNFVRIHNDDGRHSYRLEVQRHILDELNDTTAEHGYSDQDHVEGAAALAEVLLCEPLSLHSRPGGLRALPVAWDLFANQVLLGGPRLLRAEYKKGEAFEAHAGAHWEAICRYTIALLLLEKADEDVIRHPNTDTQRSDARKAIRKLAIAVRAERKQDGGAAEVKRAKNLRVSALPRPNEMLQCTTPPPPSLPLLLTPHAPRHNRRHQLRINIRERTATPPTTWTLRTTRQMPHVMKPSSTRSPLANCNNLLKTKTATPSPKTF